MIDDIFAVQSEIAEQVVEQMGLSLLGPGDQEPALPTSSMDAYLAYLRGVEAEARPGYLPEDMNDAVKAYECAVELDRARGHVLHADGDYHAAYRELELAARGLPNDIWLLIMLADCGRRTGRPKESVRWLEKALVLDPRSSSVPMEMAMTLSLMRQFERAGEFYEQAIALAPSVFPYAWRILSTARWKGWEEADRLELPRTGRPDDAFWRATLALARGRSDEGLELVESLPSEGWAWSGEVWPRDLLLSSRAPGT